MAGVGQPLAHGDHHLKFLFFGHRSEGGGCLQSARCRRGSPVGTLHSVQRSVDVVHVGKVSDYDLGPAAA